MPDFFSYPHLARLKAAEGLILKNVIYHNWINNARPAERFEFLDKLELQFDGMNLVITVPETDDQGLTLADAFDAEKYRLQILHDFGGKMDIRSDNMNSNVLWENNIGKKLKNLRAEQEGDNSYSNSALLFDFGTEKLEVRPGMDGVIIEPFDE